MRLFSEKTLCVAMVKILLEFERLSVSSELKLLVVVLFMIKMGGMVGEGHY